MNHTEMAMVDAFPSRIQNRPVDATTGAIRQYNTRYYTPYLSGAAIISAYEGRAPGGFPYYMHGIYVQTCNNNQITAPQPAMRAALSHVVRPISQVGQAPALQAPTSGIFTGVKDEC